MQRSTMIDCSEAQNHAIIEGFLLVTISFTAWWISALRSINAGPLPGPPLMVGVPEAYAARTMPSPPVARISDTSLLCISSEVASSVNW